MMPLGRISRNDFRGAARPPLSEGRLLGLGLRLATSILALPRKPIITLVLMGSMILIYFRTDLLGPVRTYDESWSWYEREQSYLQGICLMPADILETFSRYGMLNLWRLFFSALVHASELHLFYNMISLLIKGYHLEFMMGQKAFVSLVVFSLLVSQILLLFSSWALMVLFGNYLPMSSCVVGFSGVIFALKYVLSRHSSGGMIILGFEVPMPQATWLELVLISLLVPNVSFLGHLCGIVTGVMYVELPIIFPSLCLLPRARRTYTYGSGILGGGNTSGTKARGRRVDPSPSARLAEQEAEQEAIKRSLADTGGRDCSRPKSPNVPVARGSTLGEGEPSIVVGCPVRSPVSAEEHALLGDRSEEHSIPLSVTL